jgi:hypothetical protein
MEATLIFIAVVAVKMIDPLTLLVAAGLGAVAASRPSAKSRWIAIGCGAAFMVTALAALSWRISVLDGQSNFRFPWVATAIASFLQVYLISLAFQKWSTKAPPPAPE